MDTLRQDLAYALRVLYTKPGFTLVAAFTLALGIAANATIFSLINGVLLRPLPYPHPDRLVSLWASYPASNGVPDIFSPANYLDLAAKTKTLESVGVYTEASFTLAGSGQPENIPGLRMTASVSRVLGVGPQLGRWFTADEDDAHRPVVVLSHSLWRDRFGADPRILGRSLSLNGQSYTVIGVLPPGTGFPDILHHVYAPISFDNSQKSSRGDIFLNAIARMQPGIAISTAEAELRTLAASLGQAYRLDAGMQMGAVPLQEQLVGNVRPMLIILWAAVAFMLAVGCANVANLLLTHASGRQREFALRRSLGATNARLVRQLLTESLVLAGLGGLIGLVLAAWAVPVIVSQLPSSFPRIRDVGLDPQVLWFTLAISLFTGILFGLAPALGSARRDLARAIREGSEGAGRGLGQRRVGRILIVGEVAVVLVLLVGAGLVLRSLARLSGVDPGFRARGLIAWQIFLPSTRYPNVASWRSFYRNVMEQAGSLVGVQSVALAWPMPFGPVDIVLDAGFEVADRPAPPEGQRPQTLITRISPGYFATMGVPLLRGRAFTEQDTDTSPLVAIASDTLARRYFVGRDPVGQRIRIGRRQPMELQIVGVAGDVKHNNLRNAVRPELYLPMARFTQGSAGLLVRTNGDPIALLPSLQRRVWTVDSEIAANLSAPVDRLLYASLAPTRIATILLAAFAVTALVLALVGIYGVLSYAVSQRTREIGIRLALGASPHALLTMVLREALGLALAGVSVGLAAAFGVTRYLESLLFGVGALDPATYVIAALAIPCAALLAAYNPARRATQVDPATSLRLP